MLVTPGSERVKIESLLSNSQTLASKFIYIFFLKLNLV